MSGEAPPPILVARGVTKQFGGLVAVNTVDFEIPKGSIVSLIGPNGAGKTTFFNVVAGLYEPTGGSVTFGGREMIARSRRGWAEPLTWVLPTVIIAILGILLGAVGGSDLVIALTLLVALGLLIAMFLLAIIRPPIYERMLHRLGIFKSARPNDMVVAGLGRTFQNIRLFKTMTALENVMVGMHSRLHANPLDAALRLPRHRREEKEAVVQARRWLAFVGLKGFENETARNLAYGNQRRLEVARALASQPKLLLLDEPTAGMNPVETAEMTALFGRIRSELGLTILLIEHDMHVVMGVSDRVTVLDHGDKISEGTPAEVRRDPRVIEAYLGKGGERMTAGGTPVAAPGAPTPAAGAPVPAPAASGTPSGEPLLRAHQINAYYGHIHALQGITLDVYPGEIVTLLGANGAGKTTTLRTISGLMHPRTGTITFDGGDITHVPAHRLVTRGVGHAPEGRRIFGRMTVLENLQMGAYTRGHKAEMEADFERVFALFPRLRERSGQAGGTLSGGEQQMLAIGRALMTHPKLLLLDEPSMGLSPILVEQIFDVIRDIHAQGTTVLVVEQNALMALGVAHRGYILQTGRIVLQDTAANLRENPEVQRAYLGG